MYKILYITGGYYIRVPYINRCLFFNEIEADKHLKKCLDGKFYGFLPHSDVHSSNEGMKYCEFPFLVCFANVQIDEFLIQGVPDV